MKDDMNALNVTQVFSNDTVCEGRYWCYINNYPELWQAVQLSVKAYILLTCVVCVVTGILGNGTLMLLMLSFTNLRRKHNFFLFFAALEAFLMSTLVIPVALSAILSGRTIIRLCSMAGVLTVSLLWFRVANNATIAVYQFMTGYFPLTQQVELGWRIQSTVTIILIALTSIWGIQQYSATDMLYGWEPHVTGCYIHIHDYQALYSKPSENLPFTVALNVTCVLLLITVVLHLISSASTYSRRSRAISGTQSTASSLVSSPRHVRLGAQNFKYS